MRALGVLLALALSAAPARQGAAQTSNLGATCRIEPTGVDFGTYNPRSPGATASIGQVAVRCGRAMRSPSRLRVTAGLSGDVRNRTLVNGDHVLRYNLYSDVGRHRIIGDESSNAAVLLGRIPQTAANTSVFRIYGAIQPGQVVPAGEYADIIELIVEF